MERLPLETQTLYAEFLDHLVTAQARRSIGQASGCFTTKTVKGEVYYYFQYSDPGGLSRQAYIGKKSASLDRLVATYAGERAEHEADAERLQRLSAQLRVGRALTTDAVSARVLKALADCGLFQLGGVLVGTHAFTVLGNILGVRWEASQMKTQDIDIASEARLGVVLPDLQADVPNALESLEMGFLPIPSLNRKEPSTAFKVRGQAVRVEFLTPQARTRKETPVLINRFRVAAQPLPFLDYLIEGHEPGGLINGGGVLVQVPHPARFAFHKLLVSRSRDVTSQTKAQKDVQQAVQLVDILAEDRPGDLLQAWDALEERGSGWTRPVRTAVEAIYKRQHKVLDKLVEVIPSLKSHLQS